MAKYQQRKYWPTRRIHLFSTMAGYYDYSLCGFALAAGSFEGITLNFARQEHLHPYDDLNYCQICRRIAEKEHGKKYRPITQYYKEMREQWEAKNKK